MTETQDLVRDLDSTPRAQPDSLARGANSREAESADAEQQDTRGSAHHRRAFIKSYGCQMNVYDATRMADALAPEGWSEAASPEEADLVVLNTCHIRERAAEKVYSELGRLAQLKAERADEGRDMLIAVAGCVAQAEGAEVARRQPAVDLVVGPQAYHRLPQLLRGAEARRGLAGPGAALRGSAGPSIVDTEFPEDDKFGSLPPPSPEKTRARGVSAFLTIQEGCDKFCSFCVVPYTRGAKSSRAPEGILDEARRLAEAGVREITVLGQNVNGYLGRDRSGGAWTLARLIDALAAIPGLVRLRYTTSHPLDMSDDLVEAHRSQPALMPFLHLPVQSGSDRVLAAMNRRHGARDYLALVDAIRAARPDIALSSDFIVGFPGETEADFQATLDLVARVRFASAFSFKYSPREGTPGAARSDRVPEEVSRDRLARLQDALDRDRRDFNASMVGHRLDVLFEKDGRHAGQIGGKTPYLQAVHVDGPRALVGSVRRVTITAVGSNSLFGALTPEPERQA